jgi:hypothetical protein
MEKVLGTIAVVKLIYANTVPEFKNLYIGATQKPMCKAGETDVIA